MLEQSENTVIMSQKVRAADLVGFRMVGPLFIDDGDGKDSPEGRPATLARKVETTSVYFSEDIGRENITVKFCDGTPERLFDLDDIVEVLCVIPGTDLVDLRNS